MELDRVSAVFQLLVVSNTGSDFDLGTFAANVPHVM